MKRIVFVAALAILILMLAACGGSKGTSSGAKRGEHSATSATTPGGATIASSTSSFGEHSAGEGTTAEEGATAGEGATPGGAPIRTIMIKESEFELKPSNITLNKPGTYIFEAKNVGTVTHALDIEGDGVQAETNTLDAGSTGRIKVDLKKPGVYEMYCPVDGHRGAGMEGKITVK